MKFQWEKFPSSWNFSEDQKWSIRWDKRISGVSGHVEIEIG
jgi:hypothetical protein